MRTSRLSREAAQLFASNASASSDTLTRTTRSARRALKTFSSTLQNTASCETNENEANVSRTESNSDSSALSSPRDIEDTFTPFTPASSASALDAPSTRKRKRGAIETSPTSLVATLLTPTKDSSASRFQNATLSPRRSGRKVIVKEEIKIEPDLDDEDDQSDQEGSVSASPGTSRLKSKPKHPARKVTDEHGAVTIHPPSNWAEIYDTIKAMRQANPVAAVDTMGCEDLYWRSSPPRDKRYHTLTALMLSSQTKDTVTAAAMKRLHTELAEGVSSNTNGEGQATSSVGDNDKTIIGPSQLTISNIIACDPKHLDNLIGKVGFHNNKTKYIKAAAVILRDQYKSEIPSTIEGLVSLPGVGPKMAYLCMSAAWGVDEGIGVDVHVHRITNLWGWHKTKTPEETRAWLESWLPRDRWHEINKMLVGLGQTVCLPVGRRCGECWLSGKGLCKSEIRGWKAKVKVQKKEIVKQEGD